MVRSELQLRIELWHLRLGLHSQESLSPSPQREIQTVESPAPSPQRKIQTVESLSPSPQRKIQTVESLSPSPQRKIQTTREPNQSLDPRQANPQTNKQTNKMGQFSSRCSSDDKLGVHFEFLALMPQKRKSSESTGALRYSQKRVAAFNAQGLHNYKKKYGWGYRRCKKMVGDEYRYR